VVAPTKNSGRKENNKFTGDAPFESDPITSSASIAPMEVERIARKSQNHNARSYGARLFRERAAGWLISIFVNLADFCRDSFDALARYK
jgi:hypothetical protein